jgi:YVTN family beta-propeller protein
MISSYQTDAWRISLNQLNFFDPEIHNIPQPQFVTVNPNTNMIYVANAKGDIFMINGSDNKLMHIIPLIPLNSSFYINGLALNPITDKLYVICNSNYLIGNNTIFVVKNGQISKEIWNGQGYLQSIAVDPNTNLIYVANHGNIIMINGVNDEIVNNIKLTGIVKSITVNPLDNIVYISTFLNNSILVIDAKTNKLLTEIPTGSVRTWDMSIDSKTNRLFLSAEGGSRIFVIDGSSNALVKTIVAGNFSAYEVDKIAVNPNQNRIYMTHSNSGTVSVIDGSRGWISQIQVGKGPSAIAVNPDTNIVYVANRDSNTLSVIDTSQTNTETNMTKYTDPGRRFSISYPSYWNVLPALTRNQSVAVRFVNAQNNLTHFADFMVIPNNESSVMNPAAYLSMQKTPPNVSVLQNIECANPSVNEHNVCDTLEVGNFPTKSGTMAIKSLLVASPANNTMYLFMMSAPQHNFGSVLPTFEQMLASFKTLSP